MPDVLQLMMGILLVLSTLGYMMIIRKKLSLQWEFVPVFVFSSIACLVFFGGLAGQLLVVSIALLVVGLLAFVRMIFVWIREGAPFHFSFSLFQFSYLIGSIIFLLVMFRSHLTHYDNFSHWAIVLKFMLTTDAFPTPDSNLIDFKNYPLGSSSFLYYVTRFAGHSQSMMIFAQGMLIFSSLYAMFGVISEKRRFLLYAFLAAGLSTLSFFNITIRISNLLVDFLLPIFVLSMFAATYRYRNEMKRLCVVILPLAGLLTIMKSTGIIFAAIGLIFFVYTWLTHRNNTGWKMALAVIGSICGAWLPYLGWSWRMATVFQGVTNKFDVASADLLSEETGKTPEQLNQIISLFVASSLDLTTRPAIGIICFEVAVIVVSLFAVFVLKKKWNLWKALIALNVVVLLYYAGILWLYLYSMPWDEALWLAGFERYASSIVVLFVGGLVLCATIDIERSFHYKIGEVSHLRAFKNVSTKGYYQNGIWACMAIAITVLLSEYNGMQSIMRNYDTTLPYKIEKVTGDRWYDKNIEDTNRYLFYASDKDLQVTNYYMQYIGKYYLYANNVDGIVLFYEDNMDNLLSSYNYLVVVEKDADAQRLLKKHYDVDLEERIYEISKSGEQIVLTPL